VCGAHLPGVDLRAYPPHMDQLGIDRRRLGTGLLIFGVIGVVLAGIIAVALVGGAIAARSLDDRLLADQERIAASLTRLTVSMDSLAITTEHGSGTLQATSETLSSAQEVLGSIASTAVSAAGALDISLLGSRPFAGTSERLGELARTVTTFQEHAGALAVALDTNAADVDAMTEQIRLLKDQVNELATRVADFDRINQIVGLLTGGIILGALLTAWIAVGAALCAWVGLRLRRRPAV